MIVKIIVKIMEATDEIIIFFFKSGFFGAPGSFPLITSFSLDIPKGKAIKNTSHQKMIKITRDSKPNKSTPVQAQLVCQKSPLDAKRSQVYCEHQF